MNSIVFQELREARGLAYSASAGLGEPSRLDKPYIYSTFIATQNDKMGDALTAFDEVINHMPESEAAFNLAKEALIARLRTDRITDPGSCKGFSGKMGERPQIYLLCIGR